jgi:putative ABC transport system permease protein
MFYNYFKTAFRNLLRNKGYAAINIVDLAVGIAACLLIFFVIQFETSFDNFHKKKNEIYRIGSELHSQDGVNYTAGCAFPIGPKLHIGFPQIKKVASIFNNGRQIRIVDHAQQKKFYGNIFLC